MSWDDEHSGRVGKILGWNSHFRGGIARNGDLVEWFEDRFPNLKANPNPNVFLVPAANGYTELHSMLASVVPESILKQKGIVKRNADFWLIPHLFGFGPQDDPAEEAPCPSDLAQRHTQRIADAGNYAVAASSAFEEFIWKKIARDHRCKSEFFAPQSPLRLLAGDIRFWMSRLYSIAIGRADSFPVVRSRESYWRPLKELTRSIREQIPKKEWPNFRVRRPLMGGTLWDPNDEGECEDVIEEMLSGGEVMESLDPVLDVLQSHRTHEDFSDRYSWIKEDFERSFHRKRNKVRVTLLETIDNLPAWSAEEPSANGEVLFRDFLSFFDRRDRHLIVAVRQGKTLTEIASEVGHKGHAAISRRLAVVKNKLRALMQE